MLIRDCLSIPQDLKQTEQCLNRQLDECTWKITQIVALRGYVIAHSNNCESLKDLCQKIYEIDSCTWLPKSKDYQHIYEIVIYISQIYHGIKATESDILIYLKAFPDKFFQWVDYNDWTDDELNELYYLLNTFSKVGIEEPQLISYVKKIKEDVKILKGRSVCAIICQLSRMTSFITHHSIFRALKQESL